MNQSKQSSQIDEAARLQASLLEGVRQLSHQILLLKSILTCLFECAMKMTVRSKLIDLRNAEALRTRRLDPRSSNIESARTCRSQNEAGPQSIIQVGVIRARSGANNSVADLPQGLWERVLINTGGGDAQPPGFQVSRARCSTWTAC